MLGADAMHRLWFTPMGVHHFDRAEEVNKTLVRVLRAMRATDPADDPQAAFYASADDLLHRIRLTEWKALVRFIVDGIRQTVATANQGAWPENTPGLQIAIRGLWCQMSNQGRHHDLHTHGNCSWSGVYCLQVDEDDGREAHPVLGALNGVTRFYGPHFSQLGGAFMDFGNAYMQQAHVDMKPRPGQLLVFPAWLAHQAMPYEGTLDRIIVSFNASVHHTMGSDQIHAYSSA